MIVLFLYSIQYSFVSIRLRSQDRFRVFPGGYTDAVRFFGISGGQSTIMSTIFDDIHFIQDTHGPELIMYQSFNETYYQDALINIIASDLLADVDGVIVEYQTDSTWTPEVALYVGPYIEASVVTGRIFQATIPHFDYGTTVNMRFAMFDTRGLLNVDDNGGSYYSYDIIDDVNPLVEILQITTKLE